MFQEKVLFVITLYIGNDTIFPLSSWSNKDFGNIQQSYSTSALPEQELLFILLLWLPCLGNLLLTPVSPPATRLINTGRKNPPTKPQINPKQDRVHTYCPRGDLQITKQQIIQA